MRHVDNRVSISGTSIFKTGCSRPQYDSEFANPSPHFVYAKNLFCFTTNKCYNGLSCATSSSACLSAITLQPIETHRPIRTIPFAVTIPFAFPVSVVKFNSIITGQGLSDFVPRTNPPHIILSIIRIHLSLEAV